MTLGFGFCSVLYGEDFGLVRFLAKPEFLFGSFLMGSDIFPSLM